MGIQEQEFRQDNNETQKIKKNIGNSNMTKYQPFFYLGHTQNGKKILQFFQGMSYSIFITVVTLITLFLDDIRVILFTTKDDTGFSIITLCCMVCFFVEMIAFSLLKENYFMGYYFWLDLVSTLTMILDLTWINQILTGGSGLKTAASVAKVARASRASKIGAKATKLIRIIRLIRFLKLYKTASSQLAKQTAKAQGNNKKQVSGNLHNAVCSKQSKFSANNIQNTQTNRLPNKRWTKIKQSSCHNLNLNQSPSSYKILVQGSSIRIPIRNKDSVVESTQSIEPKKHRNTQNLKDLAGFQEYLNDFNRMGTKIQLNNNQNVIIVQAVDDLNIPNQTNVGTKLKDQIQKNIITMILMIIISIPLFNAATWSDSITSYEKGIAQLQIVKNISPAAYGSQVGYYIEFMMGLPAEMIYFELAVNTTCCKFPDDYPNEGILYSVSDSTQYRAQDMLSYSTDAGSVVIFQTSATSILTAQLNVGRTLFVCIVLIVSTLLFSRDVQIFALQPLQNMFDTVKRIAISPLNAIKQIQQKKMFMESVQKQLDEQKQEQTQPNILENLIVKIGGLLAVGFGQAGTQIISRVIQDPNFVNVIIPGQKIMGIYGFCDIRNFTDATQILEADVMVFVNQIAQICHKVVNGHCGSPNKNIGDAFLLVWKYKQKDLKHRQKKNLELAETKRVKQIADLAVLSFVRMVAEINKSHALLKYKNNKALQNRIKDYKGVKMGFGLHVGWSIQGPIGSQYKVDASYLSPSVNMASRLQAATKQYGVPMLITQDIYNLMTENKKYLRKVDRVMFAGYDKPTDLYTVDLHIDSLLKAVKVEKGVEPSPKQMKYTKVKQNIKRNKILEDIEVKYITKEMWAHNDIQIMRQRYSKGFYQEWENGFNSYVKGDWTQALAIFNRTKIMAPDQIDGPSDNFINIIESYGGKAPQGWQGVRQVDF